MVFFENCKKKTENSNNNIEVSSNDNFNYKKSIDIETFFYSSKANTLSMHRPTDRNFAENSG